MVLLPLTGGGGGRRKMTGMEYVLSDVMEPHLFVIRKQRRESPEKSNAMLAYYILDGSIYQAPQLCSVFASRIVSPPPPFA
jgi:mediator of RNA polymerase II transcription subunit 6